MSSFLLNSIITAKIMCRLLGPRLVKPINQFDGFPVSYVTMRCCFFSSVVGVVQNGPVFMPSKVTVSMHVLQRKSK